jgi:hypothetical protein
MADPLTDDLNARADLYNRARVLPYEGIASGAIMMLGILKRRHWMTALGGVGVAWTVYQTISVNRDAQALTTTATAAPAATINGVDYFPPRGVFRAG